LGGLWTEVDVGGPILIHLDPLGLAPNRRESLAGLKHRSSLGIIDGDGSEAVDLW
jgi:hypothetical protein